MTFDEVSEHSKQMSLWQATPLIVWIFCTGVTGRMALEPAALTSAPILLEMQIYAPHILICRMESLGIGLRKPL